MRDPLQHPTCDGAIRFLDFDLSNADCSFVNRAYKAVAGLAAKRGYRGDLREAAVQRVSAIRRSQLPEKPEPEKKLRGKKAQQAQAA
jgi:hypothetical protein